MGELRISYHTTDLNTSIPAALRFGGGHTLFGGSTECLPRPSALIPVFHTRAHTGHSRQLTKGLAVVACDGGQSAGSIPASRSPAVASQHHARLHADGRELHRRLVQHIMRHSCLGRRRQLARGARADGHARGPRRRVQPTLVLHVTLSAGDVHRFSWQLRRRHRWCHVRQREL